MPRTGARWGHVTRDNIMTCHDCHDVGGGGGARVLREGGGERGPGARGNMQHGAHHRVQECHHQVSQMWRLLNEIMTFYYSAFQTLFLKKSAE